MAHLGHQGECTADQEHRGCTDPTRSDFHPFQPDYVRLLSKMAAIRVMAFGGGLSQNGQTLNSSGSTIVLDPSKGDSDEDGYETMFVLCSGEGLLLFLL